MRVKNPPKEIRLLIDKIASLNERDINILILRFVHGLTQRKVADRLGLKSPDRIRVLEDRAIKKLL